MEFPWSDTDVVEGTFMRYLIDGYNLLHAMGVLRGRVGPSGLEKARLRLLGLLRGTYGERAADVTVVFDAAGAPPGAEEDAWCQGIHVRYAVHQPEADDLLEMLIHQDSAPNQLTVVSDDHRLQQAGRRRECVVLGCQEYLEFLGRHRQAIRQRARKRPEKTPLPGTAETKRWLREFADLEKDPNWKELVDPYGFNRDFLGENGSSKE
jgi:predicted RNA-binding protein with PIN domain